jgi:hypothetical protein
VPVVQIIAVTTAEIGSSGPVKKYYAVGVATAVEALDQIEQRLKPGEEAQWVDARSLSMKPGEVRVI